MLVDLLYKYKLIWTFTTVAQVKKPSSGGEQPLPQGGILGPFPYNSETLTDRNSVNKWTLNK